MLKVFTFKEGLLSAMGHDLCFEAAADVQIDGVNVKATVDPVSLRVISAGPSASDRQTIEHNTQHDVLESKRYPAIVFAGTLDGGTLRGELTLHGVTRPLNIPLKDRTFSIEIKPSQWGIKPFRALGGALKIADRVRIEYA